MERISDAAVNRYLIVISATLICRNLTLGGTRFYNYEFRDRHQMVRIYLNTIDSNEKERLYDGPIGDAAGDFLKLMANN